MKAIKFARAHTLAALATMLLGFPFPIVSGTMSPKTFCIGSSPTAPVRGLCRFRSA
jgi:hypothetical protein